MREATVEWRGVTADADLDAWAGALALIEAFDRTGEVLDRGDLEDEIGMSSFDPALDARLGWVDGEVVAWGTVLCLPGTRQRRVLTSGAVVPSRRRTGIGRELLGWLIERGTQVARMRGGEAPAWLEVSATDGDLAREALFRAHGFAPLRYYFEMRRPLAGFADPARAVPGRLRMVPYERALGEVVRAAHNEAFLDHFASSELDEELWRVWVTGDDFRSDLSFVVFDGDEVAAYVLNSLHPDDWPGLGFTEGWTHQLGVRRPWRHRGVANALLDATAHAFAGVGVEFAALDVDAENPTGALGLYESNGYRRDKTRVSWSLPVD
jgi:mycothiol synthase